MREMIDIKVAFLILSICKHEFFSVYVQYRKRATREDIECQVDMKCVMMR